MAGINDETLFGEDATLTGSGAGAQDVLQITPAVAIGGVAWKGIDIDGSGLDPSAVSATITGGDIDLSGVSLANDPIMNALHIQMPAAFTGVEEKHCILLEGFGSTIKLCDGDDDRAITADRQVHLDIDATALAVGEVTTVIDQDIQIGAATDGHVHCFDVTSTGSGSVEVIALSTNTNVDVIHQHIGTFGAVDQGWIELGAGGFTDSTAAFNAAGTDLPIFVNNTDLIYIGMTASFDEIEVILDTLASKDLRPDFAYSTGAGFTAFIPSDGTNGFQESGTISWDPSTLVGFAARVVNGSAALFYIRITRDRAGALTNPIEDTIQALATTEFKWDSTGDVEINSALVGISNTGVTNTIKLQNPSDTASSSSQIEASVGGVSAGDPWTQWTVGTTQSYAMGIDNSDSDSFKFTTDADGTVDPSSGTEIWRYDLSTTPVVMIIGDGVAPLAVPATLGVISDNNASGVTLEIQNAHTAADAGSNAILGIRVNGAGDSSPEIQLEALGVANSIWRLKLDNNDSDTFKLLADAAGTTEVMVATLPGEVTFPNTPAFLATNGANQLNVTGNGAVATIGYATEIFDQNSDYDATNTFTAPVTGRYRFSAGIFIAGLDATSTAATFLIVTSNRTYRSRTYNIGATRNPSGQEAMNFTVLADMDASDTCLCQLIITGMGGDTADIGSSVEFGFFGGELVA